MRKIKFYLSICYISIVLLSSSIPALASSVNYSSDTDSLSLVHIIGNKVQLLRDDNSYYIRSEEYGIQKLFDKIDQANTYNGPIKKRFRGILLIYMSDCDNINSSINKASLYESDLIPLFKEYQRCIGELSEVYKESNLNSEYSIGANLAFKNLRYYVFKSWTYDADNPGGVYDEISTNSMIPEIDFYSRNNWKTNNHNLDFGILLGYDYFTLNMNYKVGTLTKQVNVNSVYFGALFNYAYSLNLNKSKLKVGPGLQANWSLLAKNYVIVKRPNWNTGDI